MKDRTIALSIPMEVKKAVAERDSVDGWPCCILCGQPAPTGNPMAFSCAHYISRAQGGLGIPENTLTLCPRCHREYDSTERSAYRPILARHLRESYEDWNEEKLTYKRR